MMNSLTNLIKWIGFIVIPLGIIMFIKEHYWLDREIAVSVTSTVGSIVGMIPEGLYLLTTLALVAAVIRLANKKTLVHDMDCIETLARVDILCVDKTGTITENKMVVEDVIPLCPGPGSFRHPGPFSASGYGKCWHRASGLAGGRILPLL